MNKIINTIVVIGIVFLLGVIYNVFAHEEDFSDLQLGFSSFSPFFITSTSTNSGVSTTTAAQLRRLEWVAGIGTSTPIGKLTIHSTTHDLLPYHFFVASSTPTATTTTFYIDNAGNVAIGGLTNCDTIDTNASGVLACGSDATGAGGDVFAWSRNVNYNSTSTTLGFLNGFFSSGASSTISDVLHLGGALVSSSTAIFDGSTLFGGASTTIQGTAHISGALSLDTALTVANGGTGAATLTAGGVLLGQGTSAITTTGVLGDGSVIVGDGVTDPTTLQILTASGGTLRHEVGGIEADISAITTGGLLRGTGAGTMAILAAGTRGQILSINTGGAVNWISTSTMPFAASGANSDITSLSGLTTALSVGQGGTGLTSLSDGFVLLGSGAGAITPLDVTGTGALIYGDGTTDPSVLTAGTRGTILSITTSGIPGWVSTSTFAHLNVANAFTSTGTTTFDGGINITAGGIDINLGTCSGSNALNTDAAGSIICGAVSGSGGDPFAWTPSFDTVGINATSTILNFQQGFISSASSSFAVSTTTFSGGLLIGTTTSPDAGTHRITFSGGSKSDIITLASSTVNAYKGDKFRVSMTSATTTLIINNFDKGDCLEVHFVQDATGGRFLQFDSNTTYVFDRGATSTFAIDIDGISPINQRSPNDENIIRFCQYTNYVGAQDGALFSR